MKRSLVVPFVALAAFVFAASAFAHAEVSPPIVPTSDSQVFTLAVPTEKENATTTKVELTPPEGFAIDSFIPTAGWKRDVQQTGSGEDAVITKVTWDGGNVPTGEATGFQFLGSCVKRVSIPRVLDSARHRRACYGQMKPRAGFLDGRVVGGLA